MSGDPKIEIEIDEPLSNEQRYFDLLMEFASESAADEILDRIERLLNIPPPASRAGDPRKQAAVGAPHKPESPAESPDPSHTGGE